MQKIFRTVWYTRYIYTAKTAKQYSRCFYFRENGVQCMSFLYVTEPDCKIYFKDNQIVMDDNKGLLTKLPVETGKMSFRGAMQYQVNSLAKAIEQRDIALYQPLRIR